MFPTMGEILEESPGRSTENLELALGFKEERLDRYGKEEELKLGKGESLPKKKEHSRKHVGGPF